MNDPVLALTTIVPALITVAVAANLLLRTPGGQIGVPVAGQPSAAE